MIKFKTAEEMHAYAKGYADGMSYDKHMPMTFTYMGYSQNELDAIIAEYQERKFLSDAKWKWPEEDMRKLKERQKEVNEDHIVKMQFVPEMTKQDAEKKLYEVGLYRDIHTGKFLILEALMALGLIKLKEEEEKPVFEIKNKFGVEIKIWANGRVEGIEGTIINRIPALIAEAKQK